LARLRLEDHHTGWHLQLGGALAQAHQDCLMAAMNAVEVANGGDAAPMLGPQIVEASYQLHSTLLGSKRGRLYAQQSLPGRLDAATAAAFGVPDQVSDRAARGPPCGKNRATGSPSARAHRSS